MTVQSKLVAKNAVLAVKIQSTPGTFDAPTPATDAVKTEEVTIGFQPNLITTNEFSASLDGNSPLVGGMKCTLSFPLYVKGSGVPGTAPEWGKVLRVCGFSETNTKTDITATDISAASSTGKIASVAADITPLTVGTAIYVSGFASSSNNGEFRVSAVGSGEITVTKIDGSAHGLTTEAAGASVTIRYGIPGTAAASGTTTTAVLASPYAATAELYRFMPAYISGNPATPFTTFFQDYTAGRVATFTDLFGVALSSGSKVSIPANTIYVPASTNIPSASIELYVNGKRWRFRDCIGKSSVAWQAAGVVKLNCQIDCLFESTTDTAVPTVAYDATKPGIWRGSRFLLDRVAVALSSLSVDFGMTTIFPPNPNDTEGMDPPVHDSRTVSGSMDPFMSTTATRDMLTDFRAGTPAHILLATLVGAPGGTPGNRVALVVPSAQYTQYTPGKNQGLMVDQTGFFCQGQDSGAGFAIW